MELTWIDRRHPDDIDVAGAVAVLEAARRVDCPHELATTTQQFVANLRHGWDGNLVQAAVLRDGGGPVGGVLAVSTSPWDNPRMASVEVTVDPLVRRRGWGRLLFQLAVDRARELGKSLVLCDSWDQPAFVAFAGAVGLTRASTEIERTLDVPSLDRPRLQELARQAAARHPDYEITAVPVPTPVGMLADIAEMTAAINDAPTDDLDIEDEIFTVERIRAFEAAQAAHGRRLHRLVAIRRDTGALAGHTLVAVDELRPWHGHQFDTSVLKSHRGARLGLALKVAMLTLLQQVEPQLRTIDTWNAESNTHMIAINEEIGCKVAAGGVEWQRYL